MCVEPNESQRMRRRVVYQGRVQGVGFRYTSVSIARRFPVAGYVKNLRDGGVELVVDGQTDAVKSFLDEIAAAFAGNIVDCRCENLCADEQFRDFGIRY